MVTKAPVPYYQLVRVPDPAPGAEWSIKAPGGEFWLVHHLHFRLVTSAAVANRVAHVIADDQTDAYMRVPTNTIVAASGSARYSGFPAAPQSTAIGGEVLFPLPDTGLRLPPGYRLRSITDAIDVADQYTEVRALVQVFPQGPDFEWLPSDGAQVEPMG